MTLPEEREVVGNYLPRLNEVIPQEPNLNLVHFALKTIDKTRKKRAASWTGAPEKQMSYEEPLAGCAEHAMAWAIFIKWTSVR
jgi:hypothetical protein